MLFFFPAVFGQARTVPNPSEPESSREISAGGGLAAGSGWLQESFML